MGRTITALAARIRRADILRPILFTSLFSIPLDYFLPHVNFVLLFSFIFWLIVKEDARDHLIDMRLALCLMVVSLFLEEHPLETFLYFLCGWFLFKSILYLSARYEAPVPETLPMTTEEEKPPATAQDGVAESFQPIPFIPFFAGGIFLGTLISMCFLLPWDALQRDLSYSRYLPIGDLAPVTIGTQVLSPVLLCFLAFFFGLFTVSYGRFRYKLHSGQEVQFTIGDGDPIIFAVFAGILPLMTFMFSYLLSLLLIIGAYYKQKRGTHDAPNR